MMSVAMLLSMASCSQEDVVKQNPAKPGDLVQFSIDQVSTRTAYEAEDGHGESWQIDWLTGDKVTVFCNEAKDTKKADYSVVPTTSDHKTTVATPSKWGVLEYNADGLVWGGGTGNSDVNHNFYAAYPADADKVALDNGLLKFKINNEQTCTTDGTFTDGVCTTTCDMSNAYMSAYAAAAPSDVNEDHPLSLNFNPVMTTLEITLQGYNGVDQGDPIKVQGVAITLNGVPVTDDGCFLFDPKTGEIVSNSSTKTQKETFFINIEKEGADAISLGDNSQIVVTAFLPPVAVTSTNTLDVRIMAEGSVDYSVTLGKVPATSVPAKQKKKVVLPHLSNNVVGNNWITPLPDNIYISQLSIPGTIGSASANAYGDYVVSQGKTLQEQWNDGVRAFELRTSMSSILGGIGGGGAWAINCFEGGVNLNNSNSNPEFANFVETVQGIYNFMHNTGSKSGNEFAIVITGYQSEKSIGNFATNINRYQKGPVYLDPLTWSYSIYDDMNNLSNYIVPFKPDLTIGEARGKIVLICMDPYTAPATLAITTAKDAFMSALIDGAESYDVTTTVNYVGVGHDYNTAGTWHKVFYTTSKSNVRKGNNTVSSVDNCFYIQNLFGTNATDETDGLEESQQVKYSVDSKKTAVMTADAVAQTLALPENKNKWVINSIGGANAQTRDAYTAAAANINTYYKQNVLNNASRPAAPTGIVLVAHQGLDEYNQTLVYGLTMPQMIINNNYKYRAQRK